VIIIVFNDFRFNFYIGNIVIIGTQFFNVNQQFIMNYRKCTGMQDTEDAEVQFKCLGDWYVGKNHYFAVVNSRESRIEEKYRCFVSIFCLF
jgi:hypothetical protein